MKILLTQFILIQSLFLFSQAPEVWLKHGECDGDEFILTVENPNDTMVYWYNLTTNTLIDSGNTFQQNIDFNQSIAVFRGTDTTYLNLDSYWHGCHCQVYVPSAFTPDGDDWNHTFRPIINCEVTAVNLFIYNRIGKEIYFTTDLNPEWDGTSESSIGLVEAGLYVYLLYYVTEDNHTHSVNGFVNVLL